MVRTFHCRVYRGNVVDEDEEEGQDDHREDVLYLFLVFILVTDQCDLSFEDDT